MKNRLLQKKKKISLLGATGSIGSQTIDIIKNNPSSFELFAIGAKSNTKRIEEIIEKFSPKYVALYEVKAARFLQKKYPQITIFSGIEGLNSIASLEEVDFVMAAIATSDGIAPTIAAIKAGKTIGLANKEVLVCAGELIKKLVKKHKATLLPVDSEHSAIFQCLHADSHKEIARIILTASGGPFFSFEEKKLKSITIEEALTHPTYKMGKKITVDSSTLMNKALEVIEAHYLFDVPAEKIEVVIHPESIVHSMVEFQDTSTIAQLSYPDMRLPIHYAMHYPKREKSHIPPFNWRKKQILSFYPPNRKNFPSLDLAYAALKEGKSVPCYLNSANETLVTRFLHKRISWWEIGYKLEKLIASHQPQNMVSLEDVLHVAKIAKRDAADI